MTRVRYLLSEAVDNMMTNRTTTVTAVVTTAFTMLGMGVFLLLYLNIQGVLSSLHEEIKVIVYFRDSVTSQAMTALRAKLSDDAAIAGIEFVTREQALESFRNRFPSEERLLNGLGENPFPASLVLKIVPRFRTSTAVAVLVQRLQALPEVEEVLYNRDLIENLAAGLRYLRLLGILVGAVLAASMVTILANTIRLTLYARREDIEILRLIGATPGFIKTPFLLEGALLGGLGAAGSLLLLRAVFGFAETKMALHGSFWGLGAGLSFLPAQLMAAMVLLGTMLGFLGSVVSLGHLRDVRR
ncbi:MAG TPA: permease-like cell division protein FtsX [Nitrospirales bacterium]|jgi:cell division transport system permease protein